MSPLMTKVRIITTVVLAIVNILLLALVWSTIAGIVVVLLLHVLWPDVPRGPALAMLLAVSAVASYAGTQYLTPAALRVTWRMAEWMVDRRR